MNLSRRSVFQAFAGLATLTALPVKAGAASALRGMSMATATFVPDKHPWRWWVGDASGEIFTQAFDTKEEALKVAKEEANGYGDAMTIAECHRQDYDLNLSGDRILEWLYEQNEENMNEDGDFITCSDEQLADLEKSVEAVVRAWVDRHGIKVTAWTFGGHRNQETVEPSLENVLPLTSGLETT